MCQVLRIQRSSYYKWQSGRWARQAKQAADEAVLGRIRDHHQEWNHTLGYRRMTVEINADAPGEPLNHKRVARLMRQNNIVGAHLRKPKTTTVKDPGAQVFDDLINRDFTAEETNQVYVGDV
ncbi:MAG: transposase, partial [Corynebacterium sp.]|nr:transposase [Corynebacterium sp.]